MSKMGTKKAFVYTEDYFKYNYGPHHPLRIERLKLTHHLIKAYGLLDLPDLVIRETVPAQADKLRQFHHPQYLDVLRRCSRGEHDPDSCAAYGLGPGDNPIFQGMWEWSLLTTGATLQCGLMVADGEADIAFNIAGGLHHALANRASGFCYINDIAVVIKELLARNLRVAYVDVDAHHGDGVESAFQDTDQVLTISIHQHGRTLFPGTGFVYETGSGRGQGYAVNMPLLPGTDDELFLRVFNSLVPDLLSAFKPDVLVTQLGVDTFRSDPLTNLCLTTNGFMEVVKTFKSLGLPWLALGGGGYHIVNVARAWTLAWALMNEVDPPDELPESFLEMIRPYGYREIKLRDQHLCMNGVGRGEAESAARNVVDTIRATILPVVRGSKIR